MTFDSNFSQFGIENELSHEISHRVVEHRNRFARLFYNRYLEFLPTVIGYYKGELVNVDWIQVETALRNNYNVIIGKNRKGKINFLGYTRNGNTPSNNNRFLQLFEPLRYNDVIWCIPPHLRPKRTDFTEITEQDNCETGSFVVLRNKTINYNNDYEIIWHYTQELAEITLSRFSVIMQAKIMTFLIGDIGDETLNQISSALYNGAPHVKTSPDFDPEDHIKTFENHNLPSLFKEFKNERRNSVSELNEMIGLPTMSINKESGISDVEALSNGSFTSANGNIYLMARQKPLEMLSKRFPETEQIFPYFNNENVTKLKMIEVLTDENNSNTL